MKILREATKLSRRRSWIGPAIGGVAVLLTLGLYGSALVDRFGR